jgi:hypothetical protein
MLLEDNPSIMGEQTHNYFMELFKHERYWAMPRRLPELEGADIEEGLSLARHCLHITSVKRCSILAPPKDGIHFFPEPGIQFNIFTLQCDKDNNVGLTVRSDGGVTRFSAPMHRCADDEIFDTCNTFETPHSEVARGRNSRDCVTLKFGDIYSEPDKDPIYKVPPRAFAAMLQLEGRDMMDEGEHAMLQSLHRHASYWTAPRRLPELEGADLEESLSWARHCLHITSLPECSIRAPVKPDVVH